MMADGSLSGALYSAHRERSQSLTSPLLDRVQQSELLSVLIDTIVASKSANSRPSSRVVSYSVLSTAAGAFHAL